MPSDPNKREDHVILNLERLTGRNDSIMPDAMLEVCVYIHNENIVGLIQLEQDYCAALFNDVELDLPICSLEVHTVVLAFFFVLTTLSMLYASMKRRKKKRMMNIFES